MGPRTLAAIILLVVSLIVLAIGYLIGPRKQISLIAGLDVSKVRDSDGLSRWIGTGLLTIGALGLLIGLSMFVPAFAPSLVILAYVEVNLVGAAVLATGMRRYIG